MLRPLLVVVLLIAGTSIFCVNNAAAQSAKCVKLERQLASLSTEPRRRSNSGGISARYKRAIRSQKVQLQKIDKRLYYDGCNRRKGVFEKLFDRQCSYLRGQRRRMKRNLAKLQSKTGSFSNGSSRSNKKLVRRIKKRMQRARCGQVVASLKTIAGATTDEIPRKRRKRDKKKKSKRSVEESLKNFDTYKTMCVRSCDGYYFPVSFSTTTKSFKKDARSCDTLCPGAEMRLYYHRTTGETVENMISMKTGEPYSKLQSAFAYRKNFNSQCGCNYKLLHRTAYAKVEKATKKAELKAEKRIISRIALPAFRIDQGQDPETQLTTRGELTMNQISEITPGGTVQTEQVARRVRVIGEEFFPSQ